MMSSVAEPDRSPTHRLGVARIAVATGLTAVVIFVLCWLGALVPLVGPTHAYIGLFTTAPTNSFVALAQGSCWSLFFGGLSGGIFAAIFNALPAPRV